MMVSTRAQSVALAVVLLAAAGLIPVRAQADTLVSTTGTSSGLFNNNPEGVSWTLSDAYTNVAISALISSGSVSAEGGGTMYLTNSIGPGTTPANVLGETTFSNVDYVPTSDTNLFSGLTLGPGTYYLLSSSSQNTGGLVWEGLSGAVTTTASDVAFHGELFSFGTAAFAPSDNFSALVGPNFGVNVTGNAITAATPEPGSLALFGTGLLGLMAAARRRSN